MPNKKDSSNKKNGKKILLICLIALIVITGIFLAYSQSSKPQAPGKFDNFSKCLTEKGAFMYGTDWCSHCQNQKKMFGSSFQYVNFINCDKDNNACLSQGVTGYPTWIFEDGSRVAGTQNMQLLAQKTGCVINAS